MSEAFKNKLKKIFEDYKKSFPQEYEDVKKVVKSMRDMKLNKFGATEKDSALGRHILELPEILYLIICKRLNSEEREIYYKKETQRWVARQYPEFCVSEKI